MAALWISSIELYVFVVFIACVCGSWVIDEAFNAMARYRGRQALQREREEREGRRRKRIHKRRCAAAK